MHTQSVSFTGRIHNTMEHKAKARYGSRSCACETCKEEKSRSKKIALASLAGATLPIITINLIGAIKKGNLNDLVAKFQKANLKDKLKSAWKLLNVDNLGKILATTTGGVLAGTLIGVKGAKTKNDKQAIYKEGVFQFTNSVIPASFVALGLSGIKKAKKSGSPLVKAGVVLGSLAAGMLTSHVVSNGINNNLFERTIKDKDKRGFKLKDILAQLDDLSYVAVLTKMPFASKFQIDKLLPFIYAKLGYEAGIAKKEEK